ncbi:MAG: PQQ-binding-like beta-propeller repeat protein [Pseudomonadota bacterium]|nr:PQQ-binding-like beta-propeller repeat protein [Pseudomonadota bacterium]
MIRKGWIALTLMGAVAVLGACDREVIFQGERENVYAPDPEIVGADAAAAFARAQAESETNVTRAVALPGMSSLGSWTQVAANAQNNAPHVAFSSSPQVIFNTDFGQGSSRKFKVTAEPVVAGGQVFVMDAQLSVASLTTGGERLWSTDLTPPGERPGQASGGGLAYANGMVLASTGYGELVALDAGSGAVRWRQDLGASGSGAPTVSGNTAYVMSTANVAYAVNISNGRLEWRLPGTPQAPGVIGASSPAVSGNTVVMPFSLESLVGVDANRGEPTWVVPVKGKRTGRAYSVLSEITGAPVVNGSMIYAGTIAGGSVGLTTNGQIRWTALEGAAGPMVVAGGSLFMVGDEMELVRLDAATGERVWGVPLPGYDKSNPRRFKSIYPSYGPTLAGGRLWVASGDRMLRAFDPASGALVNSVELPAGAASRPVIVGGIAYIASDKGTLMALR